MVISMKKFDRCIGEMETAIMTELAFLEPGYGANKTYLARKTGIPVDVLTVLLKRLKYAGMIEWRAFFDESDGKIAGSGYFIVNQNQSNR